MIDWGIKCNKIGCVMPTILYHWKPILLILVILIVFLFFVNRKRNSQDIEKGSKK